MNATAAATTTTASGESPSLLVWLATDEKRVRSVRLAYEKRGGVFPRLFTGSTDDLRLVANRSRRCDSTSNASQRPPTVLHMLSADLASFDDAQLNDWTKVFQEYWLTMLKTLQELLRWSNDPNGYRASTKSDACASKSFLSEANLPYARLSLERVLRVFEEDMLGEQSATNDSRRQHGLSDLFARLSFENKYLAKRLVQRPLLDL